MALLSAIDSAAFWPSTDVRRWKPKVSEIRRSGELLAKEPCTICRLTMVTSPAAQTSGTAPGNCSLPPLAATIALMSALPRLCEPGMTQRQLPSVVG